METMKHNLDFNSTLFDMHKCLIKFQYLLLIDIIIFSFSCTSQDNNFYNFNPNTIVNKEFTLSDIADNIFYIPLDNTFLVSSNNQIKLTDNNIFLYGQDGIVSYNRNGTFIKKIGSIGRGPGEYISARYIAIDKNNRTIFVKDRDNIIKVYSKGGVFLRAISLKDNPGTIERIECVGNYLIAFYYLQFGNAKYNWVILDTLGNIIKNKERTTPLFNSNYTGQSGIYKFNNSISYSSIAKYFNYTR